MSKRWIFNYLLLFLIILMTWVGRPHEPKKDATSILSLNGQDVHDIKIETKQQTLSFKKQDNQWYITKPVQWLASNINLNRIASIANVAPSSSLPSNEIDLSTLGLVFPKAALTLNKDTITFGDNNQIGNRRYILTGKMVHLIPDNHLPIINLGLTGLISKPLIPKPIDIYQLKLPNFSLNFDKDKATWTSDKKLPNYSADQSNMLINQWQTKQAVQIKPYNGKTSPMQKMTALTSAGKIEFYLMHIQPEVVIARADLGLEYHFDSTAYYDFFSLEKQKMPLADTQ